MDFNYGMIVNLKTSFDKISRITSRKLLYFYWKSPLFTRFSITKIYRLVDHVNGRLGTK